MDLNEAIEQKYMNEGSYHGNFGFRGKQFATHTKDAHYAQDLTNKVAKAVNNSADDLLRAIKADMNGEDYIDFLENICDRLNIYYNFDDFNA